jgi:hypothetical protein
MTADLQAVVGEALETVSSVATSSGELSVTAQESSSPLRRFCKWSAKLRTGSQKRVEILSSWLLIR